jgi:hypothetical protein
MELKQRFRKVSTSPETVVKTLHNGINAGVILKPKITDEQKKIVSLIQNGTPIT